MTVTGKHKAPVDGESMNELRSEVEELLKKVHLENQENLLSEEEEDPIPF